MDISEFMTKKDWTAIFMAGCLLILLLLLALTSRTTIWVMIILITIMSGISFYFAWFRKYKYNDDELESMVSSLKDDLFTKKNKGKGGKNV